MVESVYHIYKANGAKGIPFDGTLIFLYSRERRTPLLTEVYDTFGQYSAWKLRDMTHEETPWQETPQNGIIPTEKSRIISKGSILSRESNKEKRILKLKSIPMQLFLNKGAVLTSILVFISVHDEKQTLFIGIFRILPRTGKRKNTSVVI